MGPETETVAVELNDRLGRRVAFILNNDQRCVVGAWIEMDKSAEYDHTMNGTALYAALRAGATK